MTVLNDHPADFRIGNLPVSGNLVLSPMDGVSDYPFRHLCRRLGSALSYTEFINALEVLHGHPHLDRRLYFSEDERPVVYQIFDDNPDRLLAAALKLRQFNPDVIDINMGCSAKNVSGRGAGAGLLREPEKIAAIFSTLSRALDIPVTGKIRLGWSADWLNYLDVARIVADNGGQLIAVHGRTKEQGYGGSASWGPIAEIKQSVSIPVIGNGDVRTPEDIQRMFTETGCDAVMIGRAAIGNPWIFSNRSRDQVSPSEIRETMLTHLESNLSFYGVKFGLMLFRKFASRYISPYPLEKLERQRLLTSTQPHEFVALLEQILARTPVPQAV